MEKNMADSFRILSFRNQIRTNDSATEAHLRPLLEIELDRAETLFISQTIDGMEMFAPVRYPLEKGAQAIFLKTMRVIRPNPGSYKIGITVSTSAAHAEFEVASEDVTLTP